MSMIGVACLQKGGSGCIGETEIHQREEVSKLATAEKIYLLFLRESLIFKLARR